MHYRNVAMLTRLRVELPQMTKQDDAATRTVEQIHGANGAGHYRKLLYPPFLVSPIHAAVSAARAYMYGQTRPYGEHGTEVYLLPNRRIMTYLDMMGKHEVNFWQNVTAFLNNWANVQLAARQAQGSLFDPGEYPDVSTLKSQFKFEYPLTPIGDAGDLFLRELNEAEHDAIVRKAQEDERRANEAIVHAAVADLRTEVLRIIKQTTVVTKVNKKGEEVESSSRIYDSLTGDIAELIGVLRDLGAGDNPALQDVLAQADMHLTIPADALRGNPDVCKITKDRATEILKSMEAFA